MNLENTAAARALVQTINVLGHESETRSAPFEFGQCQMARVGFGAFDGAPA
jgi:hypothetical protein